MPRVVHQQVFKVDAEHWHMPARASHFTFHSNQLAGKPNLLYSSLEVDQTASQTHMLHLALTENLQELLTEKYRGFLAMLMAMPQIIEHTQCLDLAFSKHEGALHCGCLFSPKQSKTNFMEEEIKYCGTPWWGHPSLKPFSPGFKFVSFFLGWSYKRVPQYPNQPKKHRQTRKP